MEEVRSLPPDDPRDARGWDAFWRGQIARRSENGWFFFEIAPRVVDALAAAGLRTILDVGCGLSMEPAGFAWAGFAVTGLDLSAVAIQHAQARGFTADDAVRMFGDAAVELQRPHGQIERYVGDILAPGVCPGPFDVIIMRRTLQYYEAELPAMLECLLGRLATPGLLIIHSHNAWGFSSPVASALRARGFRIQVARSGNKAPPPKHPRTAWLWDSSG